MGILDQAVETQLKNIEVKAGKSRQELTLSLLASGLTRHSELREHAMSQFGLGYGDANALVHFALKSDGTRDAQERSLTDTAVLDEIYTGPKAALRPIHERLMAAIVTFGEFEQLPKKGYISLRRKKQFAMIGPATNTRVEVGLNIKSLPADERLIVQPVGSMCNYKVKLSSIAEIDDNLIAWLKQAFESAG